MINFVTKLSVDSLADFNLVSDIIKNVIIYKIDASMNDFYDLLNEKYMNFLFEMSTNGYKVYHSFALEVKKYPNSKFGVIRADIPAQKFLKKSNRNPILFFHRKSSIFII